MDPSKSKVGYCLANLNFFPIVCLSALLAGCSQSPQQKEAKLLAAGEQHYKTHEYASAILDFRSAIKIVPKDAEAWYRLALAELESGNDQQAANALRRSVEFNPRHLPAQLKLTELMAFNRDPGVVKQAQEKAKAILDISPGNADALQALATAEFRLDDSKDAAQHLEQALQQAPQHLQAAVTLAMVDLRNNDPAGAEQVLLKSANEAPRSPDHAVALGQFYLLVRRSADAELQFRKALEIDSNYQPALTALGSLLYRTGRMDEAGPVFARASQSEDGQFRFLHARFLLETGKKDAAIVEFERLYKAHSNERDARSHLIWAYLKTGREPDAEKLLTSTLKRNPADAEAHLQRGELYLGFGRLRDAQSDLLEALRFRTDLPEAHLAMAMLHQVRGELAEEIRELNEVLRLAPTLQSARLKLAQALTQNHSAKAALQTLEQVPPEDRRDINFIVTRNTALQAVGDYSALRKSIDDGLAISRDPRLLLQDGLLRLRARDYAGSRAAIEELLRSEPRNWQAVRVLSLVYLAQKKPGDASRVVKEYTSKAPQSAEAQQFLGDWLVSQGDLSGARIAFEAAKSLDSNSMTAEMSLSALDFKERKFDSARSRVAQILQKQPNNPEAILQLAQVASNTGQVTTAIAYYEKAIQQAPTNAMALNNLAYLLADSGTDPDRALALARQAKELMPDSPVVDDTIGWAYYNKGLFRPALDHLKKSAGASSLQKFHLAMTYIRLGSNQEAQALLESITKTDPSFLAARQALSSLK